MEALTVAAFAMAKISTLLEILEIPVLWLLFRELDGKSASAQKDPLVGT